MKRAGMILLVALVLVVAATVLTLASVAFAYTPLDALVLIWVWVNQPAYISLSVLAALRLVARTPQIQIPPPRLLALAAIFVTLVGWGTTYLVLRMAGVVGSPSSAA